MTFGLQVRRAVPADVPEVKRLMDMHRHELGFVPLPALETALKKGWLIVAEVEGRTAGAADWWFRKDRVVVLYNVIVHPLFRGRGIGRELVQVLLDWGREQNACGITLKCPADLQSNKFYAAAGFSLYAKEAGKRRSLNCWRIDLTSDQARTSEDERGEVQLSEVSVTCVQSNSSG